MTFEEYNALIKDQIAICEEMLLKKSEEYAADADPLHNFNCGAPLIDGDPKKVLGGYMLKHTVSIYDMIANDSKEHYSRDKWIEKITDHINYLLILRTMIDDGCGGCKSVTDCIDKYSKSIKDPDLGDLLYLDTDGGHVYIHDKQYIGYLVPNDPSECISTTDAHAADGCANTVWAGSSHRAVGCRTVGYAPCDHTRAEGYASVGAVPSTYTGDNE